MTYPTSKFKYKAVRVIWDDAESDASWTEEPTLPLGPTLMLTIGFLVVDEPDYILVADTYDLSFNCKIISNTTKIPRGMIKDIQEITIGPKKERKIKVEEPTKKPDAV